MGRLTWLETIESAFSAKTWAIVVPAIYDTLYMVLFTTILTVFFGLILGIVLVTTDKDGIYPCPRFNALAGSVVNGFRSLPSMIVIILTLPLSRLILGKSYGPKACIIALAVTCIPMFGRLVESSILEVSKGKIEAARSMGAKNRDIVLKVLLPEALPSLIRSFTISVIAIISTTALAGTLGAGGLGDVAVRFGYSRFKTDILLAAVLVMIVIVQAVQFAGYITNTNRILEAGIDPNSALFREGKDSPYANVLVTKTDRVGDPAIVALKNALTAEDVRKFIQEKYNGAVVPAF